MKLPVDLQTVVQRVLAWYNAYSERDRRIILGVVVATALSLVYVLAIEPILDYRKAVEQEIADGQEELERAMRFLAAKDTLRAERDDLKKRLTQSKSRLLPGGTGTLGAAALQERANALAAEKGITVQSTQVMKEEALDPYRKVAVRLTLSGELKPLADFVSALEYGQQLVVPFVEVSRRGAVVGAKGPRTLSVTVEVNGFVQGGAKGDAGAKPDGAEGEAAPLQEAAADGQSKDEDGATAEASTAPAAEASTSTSTVVTSTEPPPTSMVATTTLVVAPMVVPIPLPTLSIPTLSIPMPPVPATVPPLEPEATAPGPADEDAGEAEE